jgi:hypothetical protein
LEQVLGRVRSLSCPHEAKAQWDFILSHRVELERMKNPHSKDKLARKGTLFEAIVSVVDGGSLWALSQVLGIGHHNLSHAVEQWQLVENSILSPFSLLERRKKQDGVSIKTKSLVILWLTVETRVSPNKKDVTHKCLTQNQYEVHTTHYLLES